MGSNPIGITKKDFIFEVLFCFLYFMLRLLIFPNDNLLNVYFEREAHNQMEMLRHLYVLELVSPLFYIRKCYTLSYLCV